MQQDHPKAKESFQTPLHKCQNCYLSVGRYILDCYCVICQDCFYPSSNNICNFCGKPTKNKKLDTRDPSTFDKVGHLFSKPELSFSKGMEIQQFQNNVTNRYVQYLEGQLKLYKTTVYDLVRSNPRLDKYFADRIEGFRVPANSIHGVAKEEGKSRSKTVQQPRRQYEKGRGKRQENIQYDDSYQTNKSLSTRHDTINRYRQEPHPDNRRRNDQKQSRESLLFYQSENGDHARKNKQPTPRQERSRSNRKYKLPTIEAHNATGNSRFQSSIRSSLPRQYLQTKPAQIFRKAR